MQKAWKCKRCQEMFSSSAEADKHQCKPEIVEVPVFCKADSHDWIVDSVLEANKKVEDSYANPSWDGPGGYEPQTLMYSTRVFELTYEIKVICKSCGDTKLVKNKVEGQGARVPQKGEKYSE